MNTTNFETAPRWLHRGIIVLLTLVAANLLAWRTVEPDLWGHIQYGEDWLHFGVMPRTATHTFTAPGHPWVNHENLFELAVAIGQRTLGGHGLMVLKCIAGLWLLWTMVHQAVRRGVPQLAAVVSMIPVAWGLSEFWLARPQLFSFVCFGLMMLCIERAFRDWMDGWQVEFRWLWCCVPLMTLWTNSHGGFAAGLCVFIAIVGLRAIEVCWRQRGLATKTVVHFSLLCVAMVLSVLVNPYGYELPYWMLVSLRQPRPEVSEWANILNGGVTVIPFLVLSAVTLASLIWTRRRRDWVELTVLGLIAVQTLGHVRHLAFFAIAFGYWMPAHVIALWQRLVEWRPTLGTHEELTPTATRVLKGELGLVGCLLAGLLGYNLIAFGVDRDEYPVSAFEFMAEHNITGRLVVTFDWAQYALAALAPATTVAFDGRYDTCYPQTVVDMHFDLLYGKDYTRRHRSPDSGAIDPERALQMGDPNLVLMDRQKDIPAVRYLNQHTDWVTLYQDSRSVLWGRRSEFDDSAKPNYLMPSERPVSDARQHGNAAWPGFPGRSGRYAFSPDVAQKFQTQRDLNATRSSATSSTSTEQNSQNGT
jgi:hypothetical protein